MGMERIKHYRVTCDGEILISEGSPRGIYRPPLHERCDATADIEAPDKWQALRNLPEGWRATGHGDILDVRCPREHTY